MTVLQAAALLLIQSAAFAANLYGVVLLDKAGYWFLTLPAMFGVWPLSAYAIIVTHLGNGV